MIFYSGDENGKFESKVGFLMSENILPYPKIFQAISVIAALASAVSCNKSHRVTGTKCDQIYKYKLKIKITTNSDHNNNINDNR